LAGWVATGNNSAPKHGRMNPETWLPARQTISLDRNQWCCSTRWDWDIPSWFIYRFQPAAVLQSLACLDLHCASD
jgi:hypothetical protein